MVVLFAGVSYAQQASSDDIRAALDAAINQRDRLANEQLEAAVSLKRAIAAYEARLSTSLEWLKASQAKEAK